MAITSVCEPGQNYISTMNLYGGTFNQVSSHDVPELDRF